MTVSPFSILYRLSKFGFLTAVISISFYFSVAAQVTNTVPTIEMVRDLPTTGAAVAVAWSPDGQALVAASNYGSILTVWKRNGERINQITRAGGGPALGGSISFLAGSSELVFLPPEGVDNNAALSIWDVSSGRTVRTINGPQVGGDYPLNRMHHFAVSRDQTFLAGATSGNSSIPGVSANSVVIDTNNFIIRSKTMINFGVSSICIFKNGKYIGAGALSHGKAFIIDSKSGDIIREINAFDDSKYGLFSIKDISGSEDGQYLFVGLGNVLLNGEYQKSIEQKEWESSAQTKNAVRIFDLKNDSKYISFSMGKAPIRQSSWDPRGRFVAFTDSSNSLYLVSPRDPSYYKRIEIEGISLSLSVSPDGEYIALATDSGVRIFSIH